MGTRLEHLTKDLPKPMINIAGKPFLDWKIRSFIKQGYSDFVLLVGHKKESIIQYFGNGSRFDVQIRYSIEEELLGTGGAFLKALKQYPSTFFILVNGDTFFDIPLHVMEYFSLQHFGVSIALKLFDNPARFGTVTIDQNYKVCSYLEKKENIMEGYINGGIYVGMSCVFDEYPITGCSLEIDIFPELVKKDQLSGIPFGNPFLDIGIPQDYYQGYTLIPLWFDKRSYSALFLDRDGILIEDRGYESNVDEIVFIEDGYNFYKKCLKKGWKIIVVSNQAGIAKGILTPSVVGIINKRIKEHLLEKDIEVSGFLTCPYHSEGIIPQYKKDSLRRKPNPGMLLDAAERWEIDLPWSCMIGNNISDIILLPYVHTFIKYSNPKDLDFYYKIERLISFL